MRIERLTGERAIFAARVVFVDETESMRSARQALALMDQGGLHIALPDQGARILVKTPAVLPRATESS